MGGGLGWEDGNGGEVGIGWDMIRGVGGDFGVREGVWRLVW